MRRCRRVQPEKLGQLSGGGHRSGAGTSRQDERESRAHEEAEGENGEDEFQSRTHDVVVVLVRRVSIRRNAMKNQLCASQRRR